MVVLEIRIDVLVPIQLLDDEVDVLVVLLGHVLHQQAPGHIAPFDHALVHAEHVTTPLGLIGAQAARSVENARVDEPTGSRLEAVGFGEVQNAVVALVPVLEALPDLSLGRARLEAHKSIREVVSDIVVLGREVVALGLAFLTHQLGLLGRLMHVVGDGPHVVEELGIHGPASVLLPNRLAHQGGTGVLNGLTQGEALFAHHHVAQSLIRHAPFVGGFGRRSEPTFVDTTAVGAIGVGVVRVEFEAEARLEEGAWHPGRSQAQQTTGP